MDVPEILMRQPACLFHTHAGEEVAQILDRCRMQQKRVRGNSSSRGEAAACWEQRRCHETRRRLVIQSSRPTDRWGEASRAQIDGPSIEHHGKASQAAAKRRAPWSHGQQFRVPVRARGLFQPYPNS